MSDVQAYEIIDDMLNNWDSLDKNDIKQKLLIILPPTCPQCKERYGSVHKYGRQLTPDAKYDAASTLYSVCPNCQYIYSYTY